MLFCCLFFLSFLSLSSSLSSSPPVITFTCQNRTIQIQGTWDRADSTVAIFYSLPYSLPPIGRNGRWKPPQPLLDCPTTSNTYDASQLGNICYQYHLLPFCATSRLQSEDCLTLDIYTPSLPTNNSTLLPVIVWIYGGNLLFGHTTSYANLKTFAETHQVVVVAISYRLGAFGYLAHPSLATEDPRGVSGNYGLLDQQMALQWIQIHISLFGGNPQSVTLIGQSSGGTSIFGLLSSPSSVGLFHSAISLSGSPNITMDLQTAYTQNDEMLTQNSNCSGNNMQFVADCLYNLSATQLAFLLPSSYNVGTQMPISPIGQEYPGLLIVDGVTIVSDLFTSLSQPIVDVPLIIQTMLAEQDVYSPNATIYAMSSQEYHSFLQQYFHSHGWQKESGEIVNELYRQQTEISTELSYNQFNAEFSFLCGNTQAAFKAASAYQSPVYLSLVAQNPGRPLLTSALRPPSLYAGHMWDYIMATNSWAFFETCTFSAPRYRPTDDDIAMGQSLLSQWLELAYNHTLRSFEPNILPVNAISDFPTNYNVILQNNTQPTVIRSYGKHNCAVLSAYPLHLNTSFWLVN
jgi:carboxylesterase type B